MGAGLTVMQMREQIDAEALLLYAADLNSENRRTRLAVLHSIQDALTQGDRRRASTFRRVFSSKGDSLRGGGGGGGSSPTPPSPKRGVVVDVLDVDLIIEALVERCLLAHGLARVIDDYVDNYDYGKCGHVDP